MGNLVEGLTLSQEVALLGECGSTRSLLGYGVEILRQGTMIERTRDPILTTLSIGVEKLYKLALGALDFHDTQAWSSRSVMINRRHDIATMHTELLTRLSPRVEGASAFVRDSVEAIEHNPILAELPEALGTYGSYGRFHFLDLLGERVPTWVGPADAWTAVESATSHEPGMARRRAESVASDHATFQRYLQDVNELIAAAVDAVWDAIIICGRHKLMGRCGVVVAEQLAIGNAARRP